MELYENINVAATALTTGDIDALAVAYGNGEALANDTIVLSDYYFEVEEKYKNNVILLNKTDAELLAKVNTALGKAKAADLYDGWYEACQIYAEVKTADELGYDDEGNKITE
jgi:ABC-type amino acid transport substrate-binding protein